MDSTSKENSDGKKDSIKLVQDITKQLITLASGILVLSATFLSDIIRSPSSSILLTLSWTSITLSIVAGLLTLSSLVNNLKKNIYEAFRKETTLPAIFQWVFFVSGIVLFWIFIVVNLN